MNEENGKFTYHTVSEVFANVPGFKCSTQNGLPKCDASVCTYDVSGTYVGPQPGFSHRFVERF